ncbi:protein starmaker-like [Diprion similis]|uniref:protein starmaker-like n=1 Tax=Diprion similis TaxID=362088 RepID=UPI001EF781EA|nr:protein starmaker-like [Diprion similis]
MARPSILVALVLFSIIACIQGKPKGHDSVNKNENTNELLRRSFNNGSNTNSLSSQTPKTPRSGNNPEKINTAAVTARASHDETSESTTADNTMTKTPIERSDSVVTDADAESDAEALELKKTKDLIKALNEASGDKLSKENALALITAMGSLLEKLDNATKTGQIARRDYNKNINKNTFKPRMPMQYVNPQPLGIDTSNLARQNINQGQAMENKTDAIEGDSRTDQDNDSHDSDDNEDDGEGRSEDHSEDDSKRDNEDHSEDDSKRDNEDHSEDDSKRDNEDHTEDDSKRDNEDHAEDHTEADSKRDNEDHSEDDSKRDNEDHSEDDSKRDNEDHSEDDSKRDNEDHSEDDSKRDNEDHAEDHTEDDSKRDNEDHSEDDSKRDNEDHSEDDSKRDNEDDSEDDSKRDNEDHSEDDSKRDNEDHSEDDSKRDNEDDSEDDSKRDNEDHAEDDSKRDNEDDSEDDSKRDNEDHAEDHSKDHSEVSEDRSEHQSDEGEDSSRQEDHHEEDNEDDDSDESSDESPESGRLLVNENFNYNKNVNQFGLQGKKDDEYYKNLFRRRLTNNIQGLESSKKNLNHLRRGVNINENTNDLPYLESRRNIGSNEESRENFSEKVGNIDKDFSKIMNTKKDTNVNYNENLNLFRPANSGLAPHQPS